MPAKPLEAAIGARIEPEIMRMGYALVRVLLASADGGLTLQIMAERQDGQGMTVDDCAAISRAVSAQLETDDPIEGPYRLEVSSPGLDRPLTRAVDFERFKGLEAKLEMTAPIMGRKKFQGRLAGTDGAGNVSLVVDGETKVFPFADVAKAKLVINDELLRARAGKTQG